MINLITILYILTITLGAGTIFAWYQVYKIANKKEGACVGDECGNLFTSKCFVGAIFFTIAFSLAIYAVTLV